MVYVHVHVHKLHILTFTQYRIEDLFHRVKLFHFGEGESNFVSFIFSFCGRTTPINTIPINTMCFRNFLGLIFVLEQKNESLANKRNPLYNSQNEYSHSFQDHMMTYLTFDLSTPIPKLIVATIIGTAPFIHCSCTCDLSFDLRPVLYTNTVVDLGGPGGAWGPGPPKNFLMKYKISFIYVNCEAAAVLDYVNNL